MPRTNIWNRFGHFIADNPKMTLAAFLGDETNVIKCINQGVDFPSASDFKTEGAYDPNPHNLSIEARALCNDQFILFMMTWGKELIIQMANACSQMQYNNNIEPSTELSLLQNETAIAVQSYVSAPTFQNLEMVRKLSEECCNVYLPYEEDPDGEAGSNVWLQLGAPWFAAETVCQNWKIEDYDGQPPPEGQSTWIKRNSVWMIRAAEAAAHYSSVDQVGDEMRNAALTWALSD